MQSTTTRFSDEEYEALVAIAEQQERSQNDIIREALRNHPDIQAYLKAKKAGAPPTQKYEERSS